MPETCYPLPAIPKLKQTNKEKTPTTLKTVVFISLATKFGHEVIMVFIFLTW